MASPYQALAQTYNVQTVMGIWRQMTAAFHQVQRVNPRLRIFSLHENGQMHLVNEPGAPPHDDPLGAWDLVLLIIVNAFRHQKRVPGSGEIHFDILDQAVGKGRVFLTPDIVRIFDSHLRPYRDAAQAQLTQYLADLQQVGQDDSVKQQILAQSISIVGHKVETMDRLLDLPRRLGFKMLQGTDFRWHAIDWAMNPQRSEDLARGRYKEAMESVKSHHKGGRRRRSVGVRKSQRSRKRTQKQIYSRRR